MSRPRKRSHLLAVEVGGVEITANLRRQRGKAGNWEVRWKLHGVPNERSTGTPNFEEAKRIARQIIRGEETADIRRPHDGMTVSKFVQIQRDYHGRNARPEAGESTLREFTGVWASFLRVCPIASIGEVTEQMALRYLKRLQGMSKTENHGYEKKSPKKLAIKTIEKHIRTLAGAWNRVREGHPKRVGGLLQHQLVQTTPWEALRYNIPDDPKDFDETGPVQFKLVDNDLGRFLDQFKDRPVGELFIITSLWCWGRIGEMTRMEWSWFRGEYIKIPRISAKGGRGKRTRIPPAILERLKSIRDPNSPYVFARWREEVQRHSGRPTRIASFTPDRMVEQMEGLIPEFAEAIGRPEITHHACRRTVMQRAREAELRQAERDVARRLQTTHGNMTSNYTTPLEETQSFADSIYTNLTITLHDFPALATRLGCDPLAVLAEREAENLMAKLTPLQRQRLARRLLGGDAEGEGQGVA
jgi:integrase